MREIETEITPPEGHEDDDGDDRSSRLTVSLIDVDDRAYDAAMQFFGEMTPDEFANGLLNVALALASLRGPDYAWSAARRFAEYDGRRR